MFAKIKSAALFRANIARRQAFFYFGKRIRFQSGGINSGRIFGKALISR
jgi:hypothetical protein